MCTLLLLGLTYSAGGLVALVLPNITPLLKYYEPSSTVAAVATLSLTVMWGGHISAAAYSVFGAWEKMLFLVATLVCAWVGPCVATEVGLQLTGGGYSIISEGWPLIWVALLVVLAFWWDADTWTARLARAVVWIGAVGLLSVNEWLSWDHSALRFVVLLTVGWVALAGVRMYIPQSNSVLGFTVSGLRRKALALGVASILGATTLAIGGYYLREAGVLALADMYLAWAAAMLLFISGAILPVGASMNYSLTVAMSRLALGAESES